MGPADVAPWLEQVGDGLAEKVTICPGSHQAPYPPAGWRCLRRRPGTSRGVSVPGWLQISRPDANRPGLSFTG